MAITGGNLWIELPKFNQTVIAHKNLFHQSGASSLMSSNNSIKRNVTLRAGTGNETGTGNEQLQYTTVKNHFHLMMAKKFVTHTSDAYAYVMLCVCHYDNNRFISFSNFLDTLFFLCFLFHRFFAFISVTFLPVLNWQHFFLLKLIILTLGQLHTNILLLRLLLLLLFFYAL